MPGLNARPPATPRRFEPADERQLKRFAGAAALLSAGRPAFASGIRPAAERTGPGLEFNAYRDYQPGEDSHRIDWRVSARARQPQVRLYSGELATHWCLCLDDSASMTVPDLSKWRLAAQLAGACAYLLIHGGHQVSLVRFSQGVRHFLPASQGRIHYQRLLNSLQQHAPETGGGATRLDSVDQFASASAHLMIFSDGLKAGGMTGDLLTLRRPGRRIQLFQVLHPEETGTPPPDTLIQDVESGERRLVTADGHARAGAALRAYNSDLSRSCRRASIRHSLATTDLSWHQVLARHLQQSAGP